MQRRVTLVLGLALAGFVLPFAAGAQSKPGAVGPGAKPAAAVASSASTAAGAAAPAAAPAGDGSGASATPTPGATVSNPAPVSVDMNAKPADTGMNGATYAVRLRDLEQRVDELKDQIRRSHTRLALLSDTIIGGGASGSRAEVDFRNEMSSAFLLTRALFVIDGQIQYNRTDDSGALADQKEIPIYTGSVPPGDHTIQVALTFQGNGYGVFSYLRGYKFDVKSSHSFTAIEGKALTITATAFEKGGVTTPLEQRPTMEWQEKVQPLSAGSTTSAPAPSGGAGSGSVSVSGGVSIGGGKK
ncbi:MAG TPA: hypothetical protein VKU41_27980 [Polyangiaceae bacterium]|nr:hypothetical protein [Polyangiaceae bacterium]